MYSKLTLLSFIRVKIETTRKNGKGVFNENPSQITFINIAMFVFFCTGTGTVPVQ